MQSPPHSRALRAIAALVAPSDNSPVYRGAAQEVRDPTVAAALGPPCRRATESVPGVAIGAVRHQEP